jgi:hypothetical protein
MGGLGFGAQHTAVSARVLRVRRLRVSGVGCFFGGTSCDFKPPPVTIVHGA